MSLMDFCCGIYHRDFLSIMSQALKCIHVESNLESSTALMKCIKAG